MRIKKDENKKYIEVLTQMIKGLKDLFAALMSDYKTFDIDIFELNKLIKSEAANIDTFHGKIAKLNNQIKIFNPQFKKELGDFFNFLTGYIEETFSIIEQQKFWINPTYTVTFWTVLIYIQYKIPALFRFINNVTEKTETITVKLLNEYQKLIKISNDNSACIDEFFSLIKDEKVFKNKEVFEKGKIAAKSYKKIKNGLDLNLSNSLNAMQFQDITSQQLEHITNFLNKIEEIISVIEKNFKYFSNTQLLVIKEKVIKEIESKISVEEEWGIIANYQKEILGTIKKSKEEIKLNIDKEKSRKVFGQDFDNDVVFFK